MYLYNATYSQQVGSDTGYAGFRNRRRVSLFTKLIPASGADILEIGPNNGLLMDAFKNKAKSITGIDINEEAVNTLGRTDILYMDATQMNFESDHFSVVIGIEVFEHIANLQKVFSEISRVLIPGGCCYLTVPFEFFRGQQALADAWHTYRNLWMCRKLHIHKLNPAKIKKLIRHTWLQVTYSKLIWIPAPSFYMVLQKV